MGHLSDKRIEEMKHTTKCRVVRANTLYTKSVQKHLQGERERKEEREKEKEQKNRYELRIKSAGQEESSV